MKNLLKKTWFQILLFGSIVGVVLILADNKFNLLGSGKKKSGIYNGPISMDKKDTYITKIHFNETTHDFGKVKEGDTLSHVFTVTNTGKDPLFIFKISGSCDCIGASFSSDVIAPGAKNDITIYFKTLGRKGQQDRKIIVVTNTDPSETVLNINAEVE